MGLCLATSVRLFYHDLFTRGALLRHHDPLPFHLFANLASVLVKRSVGCKEGMESTQKGVYLQRADRSVPLVLWLWYPELCGYYQILDILSLS